MTIGVGVIGTGFGIRVHVPAFQRDRRCRVMGLCSRSTVRVRAAAHQLKIPLIFSDWKKMIRDKRIQVVSLAVPPSLQPRIAEEALRLGKHVFLEKPLAQNLSALKKLRQWTHSNSPVSIVDFEFPELKTWKSAKEILRKTALGPLVGATIDWSLSPVPLGSKPSWKDRESKGGGLLHNFGSHVFYNVEWLLGPIQGLRSDGHRNYLQLDLKMRSGIPVHVKVYRKNNSTQHRILIVGRNRTLILENTSRDYLSGCALKLSGPDGFSVKIKEPVIRNSVDGRIEAVSEIVSKFIDGIVLRKKVTPGLQEGIRVQKIIEQAVLSNRRKLWVKI